MYLDQLFSSVVEPELSGGAYEMQIQVHPRPTECSSPYLPWIWILFQDSIKAYALQVRMCIESSSADGNWAVPVKIINVPIS